jgi:ribonuclease HI
VRTEEMAALAARLGLTGVDLLVAADGSGVSPDAPCGWAYTAWEPATGRLEEGAGGLSAGSNNLAELLPFVQALAAYHRRRAGPGRRVVGLASDSEVTVRCGSGRYARSANLPYWAVIDWFAGDGYVLRWRHVPRCSDDAGRDADRRGRLARHALERVTRGEVL